MRLFEITQPSEISDIQQKLSLWGKWMVQSPRTPKEVTKKLRSLLKGIADVSMIESPNLQSGDVSVSAYYDQDADEDGDVPFEIELFFSDAEDQLNFTDAQTLIDRIEDTLKHEMLHQTQAQSRDYLPRPPGKDPRDQNYEYMSRPDEIEAYAMNIADELVRKADKDGALSLLRMANKTAQFKDQMGRLLSPDLLAYMSMWNFDAGHPVIKRLLKKIYQYIQNS